MRMCIHLCGWVVGSVDVLNELEIVWNFSNRQLSPYFFYRKLDLNLDLY